MELNISVAARNRLFGKAVRRVYPALEELMRSFELKIPSRSESDAILVGLTDDKPDNYFVEIENSDGFFQVIAGCPLPTTDRKLIEAIAERVLRAVKECPMKDKDAQLAMVMIDEWSQKYCSE